MAVVNVSAYAYAGYRTDVLAFGRGLVAQPLRLLLLKPSYRFNGNSAAHRFVVDVVSGGNEISAAGYSRVALSAHIALDPATPTLCTWKTNAVDRLARFGKTSRGVGNDIPGSFCALIADDLPLPPMAPGQLIGGAVLFRDTGNDTVSPVLAYFPVVPLSEDGGAAGAGLASGGGNWTLSFDAAANGGILRIAEQTPLSPSAPTLTTPANGSTVLQSPLLGWQAVLAGLFDLAFGTTNPPPLVASGLLPDDSFFASYATTGLLATTPYYWQATARNPTGNIVGPVWSFQTTSAASAPTDLGPADAAIDTSTGPTLSWSSPNATSYDVAFGTTNPPPLVASGQTATTYTPGHLALSTTYYWRITPRNEFGSTAGPVWSFTTAATEDETVTVLTTTSTGTQNNFNPGTLTSLNVLRCNNATLLTLTGLSNNGATPADGTMVWIESVGAGQVDIANQAAGSTAALRVINGVTGTISLAAGVGRALLCFDATTQRWRALEHVQGATITPAFSAGNFTASGFMTWTVDPADVAAYNYYLNGRMLTLTVWLATTSIGGTVAGQTPAIAVPGGFTPARDSIQPALQYVDNGVTQTDGYVQVPGGFAQVFLNKFGGASWTPSVNNTAVYVVITFEVQ
jgi:hypothetical protein